MNMEGVGAPSISKRQREKTHGELDKDCEEDYSKRHKTLSQIVSLLESEEEEPTQDLSYLITSLQQELSSDSSAFDSLFSPSQEYVQEGPASKPTAPTKSSDASLEECCSTSSKPFSSSHELKEDEEENDKERVMRHLLEASDDELGIPNGGVDLVELGVGGDGMKKESGDDHEIEIPLFCNLWELEDQNANYYALMQSELFM